MQLNLFFSYQCSIQPLKVLFQQRRTYPSIFFFHSLDSQKRTLRAPHVKMINSSLLTCSTKMMGFFWIVWFIPEIPEQTSDWEWHKTSRSRVHHVKIHLIILHVPTFSMGFSKKCLRSGPLNLQTQEVLAEGKTSYMKSELFQNSRCHFSQF